MTTADIIRDMLEREGVSAYRASIDMGMRYQYIDSILKRGSNPRCDIMARIADALGYDLVIRDRDDGYEFVIPPSIG